MEYIALDSYKRYSFASIQNSDGKIRLETRVEHHPGAIRELLCRCEPCGSGKKYIYCCGK